MTDSDAELALYKQLIGRLMLDYSKSEKSEKTWYFDASDHPSILGVTFEHMCTNPFERAAHYFFEWGLCEQPLIGDPPRRCGWTAEFVVDLKDVPEFVESLVTISNSVSECVSLFIELQCAHRALIPTTRDAFSMEAAREPSLGFEWQRRYGGERHSELMRTYKPEMDRMVAAGYAERVEEKYRWTDRITPQMREHFVWTADNRCVNESYEENRTAQALAMWNLTPVEISNRVFSEPPEKRKMLFLAYMANFWDEKAEEWSATPIDRNPLIVRLWDLADILEHRGLFK